MATNKHAVIRYQALDKCFSNFGRRYYIDDLIKACNDAIYEFTGKTGGVKRRQIFDDITFMESGEGYNIPLDRFKDGRKIYYRYNDKYFSIKKQPLSQTEAEQLRNTIMMLNRFKGLPQFDWMEEVLTRFENTFKLRANVDSVVSFEQNPYLRGLEHFTAIFYAIINEQVLEIYYKAHFGDSHKYVFHPYFLKQYNNRWFVLGLDVTAEHSSIMNMALDRIEQFDVCSSMPYIKNGSVDFNEYFDDVIGVTVPNEKEVEKILLKVDKIRYNYIESKPIHPSQKVKERADYYVVIELCLIPNYEFETLLLGFADTVKVLSPLSLKESICNRAKIIYETNK